MHAGRGGAGRERRERGAGRGGAAYAPEHASERARGARRGGGLGADLRSVGGPTWGAL